MTLSQNGLDYICVNFGLENCCSASGLSWTYLAEGTEHPETGSTSQIVSRLASGLIENLTMITPPTGVFTKDELDIINGSPVTLQDAQAIANHELTDIWCVGSSPTGSLLVPMAVAGVIVILALATFSSKRR